MIRRPLTEITLKLDDLHEYESYRREQTNNSLPANEVQNYAALPSYRSSKAIEEIHSRIGYGPKKKQVVGSTTGS